MRSSESGTPLALDLSVAPRLGLGYAVAWGGGALAPLFSALPVALCAALAGVAMVGLARGLRRHAFNTDPRSVTRVAWEADGRWSLDFADGGRGPAELLPGAFRHPGLTVLRFRVAGRRLPVSVVITPERVDGEAFRRLRARLYLWGQGHAPVWPPP